MMQIYRYGKPVNFHHDCVEADKDDPMVREEQLRFLIRIFLSCLLKNGASALPISHKEGQLYPDIRVWNAFGVCGMTIDYIIMPVWFRISDTQLSLLRKLYEGTNIILKFVSGRLNCINTHERVPLMGANFYVEFNPVSIYPLEENEPIDEIFSQRELAEKVMKSWQELDANIMLPFLDKNMHYRADGMFNEISSSYEFIAYMDNLFCLLKEKHYDLNIELSQNVDTTDFELMITDKANDKIMHRLEIKEEQSRITSIVMSEYEDVSEEYFI